MFFHRSEGPSPRPFGCADPIPVRSPACRGSGSWTHASKRACRARTIRVACRYGTLMPLVVTGRVFGCAARVRGSRVSAAGDLDLRPPDRYPYRFHIGIPKYASNGTEPFGGDRMCPSMQDDKTCTMTKDGASGEYAGVTLSGGHKDRHLGIKIRQLSCIAKEVLCRGDLLRVKIRRRQLKDCKPASPYGADIHKKHPDSLPQAVSQAAK